MKAIRCNQSIKFSSKSRISASYTIKKISSYIEECENKQIQGHCQILKYKLPNYNETLTKENLLLQIWVLFPRQS